MWPMKLDMTKEECRGVLRRLELESYGSLISTFRAQGFLCKEKLRILEDLRRILHISNDRHRAEARRVANDERLYTVAEIICGPNSSQDWRREGHRTFPILPRSVPHTALTYIANTVYEQLTRANCKLAHPASTSCDRLKQAEEMFKFELVRKELSLFEKGFERDAAVVTSDPLQDIMSKSYIHNEDKPTEEAKPEEPACAPEEAPPGPADAENKPDAPAETVPPAANDTQPSLSDILLENVNGPTITCNTQDKVKEKSTKSAERARKRSEKGTKRQSKVKSPYPAGKPSKNGPVNSMKQSSKTTSIPSPHLMHSYAVPFDVVSATNGGTYYPESPQLQQHLTSNLPYPPPLGYRGPQPYSPGSYARATASPPVHSHALKHQQGILPSSKRDIQYNLSRLNPTNSVRSTGAMVPQRGPVSVYPFGAKPLPQALLNYQKKTNSKNILIPTSAAAATLASLGLPLGEHASDWISSKGLEFNVKASRLPQDSQEVPSPRVDFSPTPAFSATPEAEVPSSGDQEPQVMCPTVAASDGVPPNSAAHGPPDLTSTSQAQTAVAFSPPAAPPVVNNVLPLKQPNIAGFMPVKSGSKLSVSKTQLMPLIAPSPVPPPAQASAAVGIPKNNVFILPKPNVPGTLNVGQKISIPKCIIEPAGTQVIARSPPKVIVQPVPNANSVASFDLDAERKAKAQMRQLLFGGKQLPTEASQLGLTPMEIAAGETLKVGENLQRLAPVEGAVTATVQPVQLASIAVPGDGNPVRKITISASQLIPFKGTLRDGTTLPMATISANTTAGVKQIKLSNCTAAPGNVSKTITTDWEQEVDRANGTQQAPAGEVLPTSPPGPPADSEVVEEVAVELDVTQQPDNRRLDHSTPNTEKEAVKAVPASNNQQAVEKTQGDYDAAASRADRGDDSSATDSADAEEDPEDDSARIAGVDDGIEEDDYGEQGEEGGDDRTLDVEADTEGIIIEEDEANYDCLIEEVPEDENYIEEIVDEQMEISYDSSRELEQITEQIIEEVEEEPANMNGIEEDRSEMHFVPCEMVAEDTIENGDSHHQPVATAHPAKDDIVCELLEIDADGTYSTRQFSYEQAIAEGLTVLPTKAKPSHKTNRSVS